jgi:hypothetical protein
MFKCYNQHLILQRKEDIKGGKSVQKRPVRVSGLLGSKEEDGETEHFQLLDLSDKENKEAAVLPSTSLKPACLSVTFKQLQAKHKKEERDTN